MKGGVSTKESIAIAIMENAISSFNHGIEHLLDEVNEKNIKFCTLHIFNAVELITVAHLLTVNEALLWPDMDKKNNEKTADISKLIKRMNQFSNNKFSEGLETSIEKLRLERNRIEHKEFAIKDKEDLLNLLFPVIEGLIVFISGDVFAFEKLPEKFLDLWEHEYVESYMKIKASFDNKFKETVNKIEKIKKIEGVEVDICKKCYFKTLPYKKEEGIIKCLNCGNELFGLVCSSCSRFFYISKDDNISLICQECGYCSGLDQEEVEGILEEDARNVKQMEEELESIKEKFKYQKFE